MLIGYAQISKADGSQSLDLQRDALRGFGGIRTRVDSGTDLRWIGLCTSQGQEGRVPSRAELSAGAASSGSDGAARYEGQRAMPGARRNQGADLPLRSARWFLEKPRATGPGSLDGPDRAIILRAEPLGGVAGEALAPPAPPESRPQEPLWTSEIGVPTAGRDHAVTAPRRAPCKSSV